MGDTKNSETIGALRHRLDLERVVRTPDGGGGVSESWVVEATVWGAVRPLTGSEAVEADRIAGTQRVEITIRYRAGVDPAMRFRKESRVFHILSVENIVERNVWIRALCEERDL